MTEPTGLMLSYSAAAAKLAAAFWLAQIAIVVLRRGASVPLWQIGLGISTACVSTIAWRADGSTGWFIACLLALVMVIDGLRRWMSSGSSKPSNPSQHEPAFPVSAITLAITGGALCTYAITVASSASSPGIVAESITTNALRTNPLMIVSLISLFVMFGLLLASTLELTLGSLGAELLALPWQRIATITTFVFLIEILLAGWVVAKLNPAESVEMTAAPIMYEFSRLLLGYIAWCIPRRMAMLANQQALKGQASLALSGWIGLICFAVAMALPTAWPWNALKL